jgi:hypothetical protein
VLLVFPTLTTAQCEPQLTVQNVLTQDTGGTEQTTFAPGETIRFVAEVDNAYGGWMLGANGTELAITTSFYADTISVDIPPGVSTWTWEATTPSEAGDYTVEVRVYDHFCGISGGLGRNFTVTGSEATPPPEAQPAITLDPTEGPAGTQVTVTGSGWIPGDTVYIHFAIAGNEVAQATVADDGSFVVSFTVPSDAEIGEQLVIAGNLDVSWQTDAPFHVVTEQGGTSPPFDPAVAELRFYESGYEDLPLEQRVYEERFASENSRYINWELDLEYSAPGSPVDFKITAIYLRDTGAGSWEEFHRHTVDAHVEEEWTGSLHWSGYGYDDPGNWAIGFYRVDIYFEGLGSDGQLIASQGFEVFGEGGTGLVANAGPDQTVPGPSPVAVQFDGSGSTGDIVRYQWYNQYGLLLAEGVTPVIEVNFGRTDPQPGTQRTFTLVVEDSQGNTAEDQVTMNLSQNPLFKAK